MLHTHTDNPIEAHSDTEKLYILATCTVHNLTKPANCTISLAGKVKSQNENEERERERKWQERMGARGEMKRNKEAGRKGASKAAHCRFSTSLVSILSL